MTPNGSGGKGPPRNGSKRPCSRKWRPRPGRTGPCPSEEIIHVFHDLRKTGQDQRTDERGIMGPRGTVGKVGTHRPL